MRPDLPEVPLPWLPATPVELAQPAPAPSLREARSSQAPPVSRAVPPKHGGRRTLVSVLVLGALGAGGYLAYTRVSGSDASEPANPRADPALSTPVADAATTPIADTILPHIVDVRPAYRAASFVETSRQIGKQGDVPFEQNIVITAEVDYVTPVASLVFDVQGSLSTLHSELIMTGEHSYREGDSPDGPWERRPREPSAVAMDAVGYLKMYGEVVTAEVRAAATGVVETNDVVNGTPVRTFRFDVPWTTLTGIADPTSTGIGDAVLDDGLRVVHVTLSVDSDGLLWVYDQQYDEQAWIDAAAAAPADFEWFSHVRTELISTSNVPSTVVPPASFVDVPTN
jgi:hypothetical protein